MTFVNMKKKFKSDAFEAIHESASALHSVGAIDRATMREFDEACIVKTAVSNPTEIKKIGGEGLTERIVGSKVGGGN